MMTRPSPARPTISVLIANYNGIGVIDACITSVLVQDPPVSLEIIVHDDASTDGSAAYVRERFPEVTLIESKENVGFCISNNRMAAAASGEFLLLLNNDATLLPDSLQVLSVYAQQLAQPAILTLPQYNAETGVLIDVGSSLDPFLNAVPNRQLLTQETGIAIGACLWIPKSLWETLGGFPAWFGSIGEDLYLCCVARLWGYPVRALGISGFRHVVGRSLGGGKITGGKLATNRRRRALSERNKCYVMALTFPAPLYYLIFPLTVLILLAEGIVISIAKQDSGLWKTIYAPLLPALWEKRASLASQRKEIQQKRQVSTREWLGVFTLMPYKLKMLLTHGLPHIH